MEEILYAEPWVQHEGEPDEWYRKFADYYLPLGIGRSLVKAYINFAKATNPEQAAIMATNRPNSAPNSWSTSSNEWNWMKRARAWDAEQLRLMQGTVDQARVTIQMSALEAVNALVKALDNPRTSVSAAKEILDRAGLPAVQAHIHKLMPFTADELARARQEIEEWETSQVKSLLDVNG